MKSIRLDEMTWPDVKACMEEGVDTVVFGVGATEQHGPSLPLMTDHRVADFVAGMIAINMDRALQAPTILVGHSDHHLGFPGTVSLSVSTLQAMICDYVRSLARHGFNNIVITNHHGGNCGAIEAALADLKPKYPNTSLVYFYDQNTTTALENLCHKFLITPGELGTHAGDMETSIMMFLEEKLVEKDRLVKGYTGEMTPELRLKSQTEGFESVTETGVLGDQRQATREKGEIYIKTLKEVILTYLKAELRNRPGSQN